MRRLSSWICGAALVWSSLTGPAFAETAQDLADACAPIAAAKLDGSDITFPDTYATGECWGAFAAIQELSRRVNSSNRRMLGACTPAKSKRGQLIKAFTDYVRRHSEQGEENFVDVAIAALKEAYPCN